MNQNSEIREMKCNEPRRPAECVPCVPPYLSDMSCAQKTLSALTRTFLQVPCVAVVENMSHFEVDGVRHFPFGKGSGDRIVKEYGLSNLVRFPIVAELSAAGDGEALDVRNHPGP